MNRSEAREQAFKLLYSTEIQKGEVTRRANRVIFRKQ